MRFEEFVESFKVSASNQLNVPLENFRFYPEGFTSDDPEVVEWIKDANQKFLGKEGTTLLSDFLTVKTPQIDGAFLEQRLAIRSLYEDAEKNGYKEVLGNIQKMQEYCKDAPVDSERLNARASSDYEAIREQLILRPLNYSIHARELKGCVYRKINDFVLVLYQVLGDKNHTLLSSKIKRDELQKWGMEGQEEKVMQDAIENTARLYPPCVYDNRTKKEENFLEKEFSKDDIKV